MDRRPTPGGTRRDVHRREKGGGGSQIGTKAIADALPDGMALGFIDTAFVINPGLVPNLPYDTRRDFALLSLAATTTAAL